MPMSYDLGCKKQAHTNTGAGISGICLVAFPCSYSRMNLTFLFLTMEIQNKRKTKGA
jgi:hypothetical protein